MDRVRARAAVPDQPPFAKVKSRLAKKESEPAA